MRPTQFLLAGTMLCIYPTLALAASPEEMEERLKQTEVRLAKFEALMENANAKTERKAIWIEF